MANGKEARTAAKTDQYFCWVRVVNNNTPTSTAERTCRVEGLASLEGDAGIKHWNLPPLRVTAGPANPGDVVGVWGAVSGYLGRDGADTMFDFGPAFETEAAAGDWLANTPDGRSWDDQAPVLGARRGSDAATSACANQKPKRYEHHFPGHQH
jgi:hypothetical protein